MTSRRPTALLLLGLLCLVCLTAQAVLDFDRMQQALTGRFGNAPLPLFNEWRQAINSSQSLPETEKLIRVNDFINRRILFDDDIRNWGQTDYWATPIETLGRGAGDCEDFSIVKYYSLLSLGVPVSKLRLVYVKALQTTLFGQTQQGHMVLAYYSRPSADPLILDNLNTEIRPASQRPDLSPIFSFNGSGVWMGTGNQSSKSNLSRWQDLLQRAHAEGFE